MARTPNDPALAEINFLTVSEVAALMRVSRMTVYRLVHSEALPAVRVGRSFRVSERAVHEYLQRGFNATG
ncbi:DNA-binding protein [Nakamurella silvestris]|nr:DNA-binding protein [Nakamurella silvestris]